MADDPFRELAQRYDWMQAEDPARISFFRDLFNRHGVHTVLDCACGTGHDLLMVHRLGRKAWGSDISEAMLEQARRNLEGAGVAEEVLLRRCDFRELPAQYAQRFDAVLCLSTALPQVTDETEIVRALRSMLAVLAPGGITVLTQGMTDRQYHERSRFDLIVNTADISRVMVIDYAETEWQVHILDLTHSQAEQRFDIASFRYRLLLRDDYARLLEQAGYEEVIFHGGWDGSPYDKASSRRLIIVARKKSR
ncbi:MAG: class I SAM-dependent methyltransferase [Anaerolineae bacterium]|nr:class I SAM-dependent methyltransferase [Anaerolineae bacterium]